MKYCTVDQVKKDMIGRACGLNDRGEEFVSCFNRKSGGNHLENKHTDGRIILQSDLRK